MYLHFSSLHLDTPAPSSYSKDLTVYATITDPAGNFGTYTQGDAQNRNILSKTALPLSFMLKIDTSDVGLFSHSHSFTAAPAPTDAANAPTAALSVQFLRPNISIIFPTFLACAFWLIALGDVVYLFGHLGTTVKVTNPSSVSVTTAVLFALPSLRNASPGNAPIGSVIDYAAYFWSVLIAVCCFLYAVARYAIDNQPVQKKAQ